MRGLADRLLISVENRRDVTRDAARARQLQEKVSLCADKSVAVAALAEVAAVDSADGSIPMNLLPRDLMIIQPPWERKRERQCPIQQLRFTV
jgi:hypothetical protein